jgi:phosphatidylglycerol:prolipoprotein diacylglycerol transferase
MWIYSARPRPVGAVSGVFLIGYGVFRSFAEFFREPDEGFMGMMTLGISMGQWLSLPMILAGVIMLVWAYRTQAPVSPRGKAGKAGKTTKAAIAGKRGIK